MEKLKSTLPNMFLSLMVTCAASGVILGGANIYTAAPIAASKAAALEKAIREVAPEFDNDPLSEAYMGVTADGDSLLIYPATREGRQTGVAVNSYSKKGFSGEIKVIVGFDTEGALINYSVLRHSETPGLGSKMEEWFRAGRNNQSVIGRSLTGGGLAVSKDGGEIDAITASTISSRAFLDAINRAYDAYRGTDSVSGATTSEGGSNE
ncbi:MAG: RnfABCDGE type electron transport complex subunit G [Tannerellaceae bacterium]|jgi:electron transport complex protein RnfG|nr:RnfABCDGE type electron transport complex subunit G [Tannerellaceae bacterium]